MPTQEKTNPKLLVSYSFGEIACQMSWYMINTYLMAFYTDVVTLSAGAISMIMLIARVWDTINDPMMGNIADHTKSRWGRFRPYMIFGAPVLAIFNILTFTVFPVTGWLKVVLALVCYVGAGMAYTACSIAYQALQNVIAIDSRVRMNLATARGLGSQLIGVVLSLVAMPMILHFSHTLNADGAKIADAKGYFVATVILSLVMIPLFWLCAAGCKETYTEKLHAGHQEKIGFLQSIKELVKNDQLLMVVLATVFGAICVSGRMGMLFYYIVYVVGGENPFALISPTFTTMTVAALIGVAILPWTTKWFGKRNWMLILNAVMVAGFILMFLFPTKQLLFPLSFLCGIANSGANICPGMIGDSLEYGDWKLGKRQEGLVASFLSFGVKLATAFVGSVGVLLLSAVGYVPNAAQTPAACTGINVVVNIIPAVIGVLSMVPLFWYKLDDKRVAAIRADLEAGVHAWDKQA